jgi:hypothetical protein
MAATFDKKMLFSLLSRASAAYCRAPFSLWLSPRADFGAFSARAVTFLPPRGWVSEHLRPFSIIRSRPRAEPRWWRPESGGARALDSAYTAIDADGDLHGSVVRSENAKIMHAVKTVIRFLNGRFLTEGTETAQHSRRASFQLTPRTGHADERVVIGRLRQAKCLQWAEVPSDRDLVKIMSPSTTETTRRHRAAGDPQALARSVADSVANECFIPGCFLAVRGSTAMPIRGYKTGSLREWPVCASDWSATTRRNLLHRCAARFLDFKHTALPAHAGLGDSRQDQCGTTRRVQTGTAPLTITDAVVEANDHDAVLVGARKRRELCHHRDRQRRQGRPL